MQGFPAMWWVGLVDPYHSEKKKSVIYNEKERKMRHKDQAKWPQIFFPLLVISQTQQW